MASRPSKEIRGAETSASLCRALRVSMPRHQQEGAHSRPVRLGMDGLNFWSIKKFQDTTRVVVLPRSHNLKNARISNQRNQDLPPLKLCRFKAPSKLLLRTTAPLLQVATASRGLVGVAGVKARPPCLLWYCRDPRLEAPRAATFSKPGLGFHRSTNWDGLCQPSKILDRFRGSCLWRHNRPVHGEVPAHTLVLYPLVAAAVNCNLQPNKKKSQSNGYHISVYYCQI